MKRANGLTGQFW